MLACQNQFSNGRNTNVACVSLYILARAHRANFIVVVPGANYHLSPEDVTAAGAKLKGAKVMVVRYFARTARVQGSSCLHDESFLARR